MVVVRNLIYGFLFYVSFSELPSSAPHKASAVCWHGCTLAAQMQFVADAIYTPEIGWVVFGKSKSIYYRNKNIVLEIRAISCCTEKVLSVYMRMHFRQTYSWLEGRRGACIIHGGTNKIRARNRTLRWLLIWGSNYSWKRRAVVVVCHVRTTFIYIVGGAWATAGCLFGLQSAFPKIRDRITTRRCWSQWHRGPRAAATTIRVYVFVYTRHQRRQTGNNDCQKWTSIGPTKAVNIVLKVRPLTGR